MKRLVILFLLTVTVLTLCSCDFIRDQFFSYRNPLEDELVSASRILFTNNKDRALRFTVADTKVIRQIGSIVSRGKIIDQGTDTTADYTIEFFMQNGKSYKFVYWMGASQNGKEVNLKDEQGVYYSISESLDVYILNSTKMNLRPNDFVELYSSCISEAISNIKTTETAEIIVGVDIKSDRRMSRYTMSYEEERLVSSIMSHKYTVTQWTEGGNYTYVVSFLTNIYNPDKAEIVVDIVRTADQTKQSFTFKPTYANGAWSNNMVIPEEEGTT